MVFLSIIITTYNNVKMVIVIMIVDSSIYVELQRGMYMNVDLVRYACIYYERAYIKCCTLFFFWGGGCFFQKWESRIESKYHWQ